MSEQSPLDLAEGDPFGPHNLPYGVFSTADDPGHRRVGVRIGDHVLDAGAAAHTLGSPYAALLARPTLNPCSRRAVPPGATYGARSPPG